jgi:hypothetical protein
MISRRFIRFATTSSLILTAVGASGVARAQTAVPVVTGVSGALQAGSSLTITGINFGQKSVAAPLKWDNFEGGTAGSNVGNGWSLSEGHSSPGSTHYPIYSTSVLRTNSGKSVQARFDDQGVTTCADGEGCQYSSNFGITGKALPRIYLDAWVYYSPANPSSRNVKLFRVHTNSYAPNLYFNIYCLESTDGARLAQDGGGSSVYVPDSPWRGSSFFQGTWRHIQAYLVESSPNVADGTALLTVDNYTSVSRVGNFMTRTLSSQFWNTVWLGNYVGHGVGSPCSASPGNTYVYWDDAYVDTTRSHVEIGDAATYAACKHTEIQIPTSWSPSSISVTANPGSFASLTNAYVYVTDQNGAVNSIGLKLGGTSGDLISPAPVRDLRSNSGP